jgi:predicted permease
LRPLPVKDPGSLRVIDWTDSEFPKGVSNINGDFRPISGGRYQGSSVGANLYRHLAQQQSSFAYVMGVADPDRVAIATDASPAEQFSLQYVSSNFFQGVGVSIAVGRPFLAEEDRAGHEPVVVVSHRFWMNQLDGDPHVPGRVLRINNVSAQVIGVAPARFFGVMPGEWPDVYAPLAMRAAFQLTQSNGLRGEDDRDWWVRQMGRLKPGVPEDLARAQLNGLFRSLAGAALGQASSQKVPELVTMPGRRGVYGLDPKNTSALWILLLLVGVLLLIVCVNVANLLLSRSIAKQRESAVRLALGAARTRLFRQHLIESGVLALLGGTVGLAFGYLLAQSIQLLIQSGSAPGTGFDLHLDLRILAYTGLLSITTAFLFGLIPALRAARADLNDALKAQTRSVVGGRMLLPSLFVTVQVALCLTALVAAGLLGRSLKNLQWVNIGFNRENLAYATVNPWQAGYTPERVGPYVNRLREELRRLPGVVHVSLVEVRLLSGDGNISRVSVPGRPLSNKRGLVDSSEAAFMNHVGDNFFKTLEIPLLSGRPFEPRDLNPNSDAVVVDEFFSRHFFPNRDPLGRRFGMNGQSNNRYRIVGVVADTRYFNLRDQGRPTVYFPFVASEHVGAIHFAIRAGIDSDLLVQEVRRAVATVDPTVPLNEFHTQTALIDRVLRTERLLAFVSSAFGIVALTLAAIGIGGLLAYSVARRTNEIGIRMAVGAAASDIVQMVLRDSLSIIGIGIILGLPCAYAIGRILQKQLFDLKPLDPTTVLFSFLTLAAIALLAAWTPARRAAKIEPITALREE